MYWCMWSGPTIACSGRRQPVGRTTNGNDWEPPMPFGAHQHEADAGVVAQRRDELWVETLDALERKPPRLAWERDEPQAARGHHRQFGRLAVLRPFAHPYGLFARFLAELHSTVYPLALCRHADRAAKGIVCGPSFGQRCAKVSGCLVATSFVHVDAVGGARLAHDILQRRAIALEEGSAL